MKRWLGNGMIVLVSVVIALLLSEIGARFVVNPADYLSSNTVRDEVLGIRVVPGTGGFDAWGFRNRSVPESAEIVAIGDSHTYGNNATMGDSWPYVAGRLTRHSVYNLGLGGYGPNQYYHLLETRALRLKPRWVIVGLYMGDDFENAFLMTYGREYWTGLRSGERGGVDADIWGQADQPSWHRSVRAWLSRNSLVYRMVVHGPVLGNLKGSLQIKQAGRGRDDGTVSLIVPGAGIEEAFRPQRMLLRLDQRNPAVREGMRITFTLLDRMNEMCRQNGCQLVAVLIPTKETVFADRLLRAPEVRLKEVITELVEHEAMARKQLVAFFRERGIPYVDALPALTRRVSDGLYTRSHGDMHPNRNGYRVIGEAVAEFLVRTEGGGTSG